MGFDLDGFVGFCAVVWQCGWLVQVGKVVGVQRMLGFEGSLGFDGGWDSREVKVEGGDGGLVAAGMVEEGGGQLVMVGVNYVLVFDYVLMILLAFIIKILVMAFM